MIFKLILQLYKELDFRFQEAVWLEFDKRLLMDNVAYSSIMYDERRMYGSWFPRLHRALVMGYRRFWVLKIFFFNLFNELKTFTFQQHICLYVSLIALFITSYNFIISFIVFYESHQAKITLLKNLNIPMVDWYNPTLFLSNMTEFYLLKEIQLVFAEIFWKLIFGVLMILPVLLIIAYSTLLEWKVLSAAQWRRGPNKVGIKGSTQPLIDGVKLILKEIIIPVQSENRIFVLSSIWSIFFMLLLWFIIPTSKHGNVLQFNYELLVLFCVSVLGSISILLAGWSSNSKYAFLGGVRAGAQMISYELVLGLIVLIVMTATSTTQIIDIVEFQETYGPLFLYLPMETILFLILIVAETNRAPFDFAEAESELVSGYNTEYSGLPFAFFFIAEYGNILYMSLLTSLLFFGGWSTAFLPTIFHDNFYVESFVLFFKTILIYFFFLWLWAALPWYRYDQLMNLCWKVFLPLVLLSLVIRILTYLTLN